MRDQYEYGFGDIGKLIMAVSVVAIHTQPLHGMSDSFLTSLLGVFINCAVPFFFMSSGFFVELKKSRGGYLFDSLKKFMFMYLTASAAYLPLAIYNYLRLNYSPTYAVIHYLRSLFLVGSNYNSAILWYLLSSIYALIFVIALSKKGKQLPVIVTIGFLVFCFGIVCSTIVENQESLPEFLNKMASIVKVTIRNGRIFSGFFYIPLGMLLAGKRPSLRVGVLLAAVGITAGGFLGRPLYSLFISLASVGLFTIAIQINLRPSNVLRFFRKLSMVVYFTHMYIWTVYCSLRFHAMTYGFEPFVAVTGLSILLGCLYGYFSRDCWIKERTLSEH